jgi:membrane protein DedA with SNARE-associated domain
MSNGIISAMLGSNGVIGYILIATALAANCLGVPIASEVMLPLLGLGVHLKKFSFIDAFSVAVIGQLIGFITAYLLARRAGLGLIERGGHYLFISHLQILHVKRRFRNHSTTLMLLGLLTPGIHGYLGYTAGLVKLSVGRFIVTITLGTVIWTAALIGLGDFFGNELPTFLAANHEIGIVFTALLLVVGVVWYSRQRQKRHTAVVRPSRRSKIVKVR